MATTERLPWLHDAPPATAASRVQKRKGGSMWPWYLLLLVLIAAVGAGAWWLSTAEEAAPPQLPAEQSTPIPVADPPAAAQASDEALLGNEVAPDVAVSSDIRTPVPAAPRSVARRPASPASTADEPDTARQGTATRSIFPADEPAAAPPAPSPKPAIAYNPRPYGGRVVQLGAFPTRAQAEANWRRITRRYPYLATKAKMVNTVDVRGLGGGRPTRMYRLQLGTSSQAQSVVICQQLERAGHSCVVVY